MKINIILGFVVSLCVLTNCKKSDLNTVVGNVPTDNTIKAVLLADDNDYVLTDLSGSMVTVENSNPLISVGVNSQGGFQLPKLPNSGSICLVFSHANYGTIKQYYPAAELDSIAKGKADFLGPVLLPKSKVYVNSFSGSLQGDVFKANCNISVPKTYATNGITIFAKVNNPDVTYENCTRENNVSNFMTMPVINGNNTVEICTTCLKECGFFKSGDVVYLKAYGNIFSKFGSDYLNPITEKYVFPNINANSNSETISFVVP